MLQPVHVEMNKFENLGLMALHRGGGGADVLQLCLQGVSWAGHAEFRYSFFFPPPTSSSLLKGDAAEFKLHYSGTKRHVRRNLVRGGILAQHGSERISCGRKK